MSGFDRDRVWEEGYEAGRSDLLDETDLSEILAEEARVNGFDLLEGVGVRWDAAEKRLVFYET